MCETWLFLAIVEFTFCTLNYDNVCMIYNIHLKQVKMFDHLMTLLNKSILENDLNIFEMALEELSSIKHTITSFQKGSLITLMCRNKHMPYLYLEIDQTYEYRDIKDLVFLINIKVNKHVSKCSSKCDNEETIFKNAIYFIKCFKKKLEYLIELHVLLDLYFSDMYVIETFLSRLRRALALETQFREKCLPEGCVLKKVLKKEH